MGLESADYISQLNSQNPAPGDSKSEGDDHMRLIKKVLKQTFPNLSGPVSADQNKLNGTYYPVNNPNYQARSATVPAFEWHRPGSSAFMQYIEPSNNRLYMASSNGAFGAVQAIASFNTDNCAFYTPMSLGHTTVPSINIAGPGGKTLGFYQDGAGPRFVHCVDNYIGFLNNSGGWVYNIDNGGNSWQAGNGSFFSDERFKRDWRDLHESFVADLAEVKHGVYDRIDTGDTQVGVSAQSLRLVLPEAVVETQGKLGVEYGNAALVSCIQLAKLAMTQARQIALLQQQVTELMARLK